MIAHSFLTFLSDQFEGPLGDFDPIHPFVVQLAQMINKLLVKAYKYFVTISYFDALFLKYQTLVDVNDIWNSTFRI